MRHTRTRTFAVAAVAVAIAAGCSTAGEEAPTPGATAEQTTAEETTAEETATEAAFDPAEFAATLEQAGYTDWETAVANLNTDTAFDDDGETSEYTAEWARLLAETDYAERTTHLLTTWAHTVMADEAMLTAATFKDKLDLLTSTLDTLEPPDFSDWFTDWMVDLHFSEDYWGSTVTGVSFGPDAQVSDAKFRMHLDVEPEVDLSGEEGIYPEDPKVRRAALYVVGAYTVDDRPFFIWREFEFGEFWTVYGELTLDPDYWWGDATRYPFWGADLCAMFATTEPEHFLVSEDPGNYEEYLGQYPDVLDREAYDYKHESEPSDRREEIEAECADQGA